MAIFAATRLIAMGTAAFLLPHGEFRAIHQSLWGWMVAEFDSNWYTIVAAHGYPATDVLAKAGLFKWFPGYPAAIDAIAWIPGLGIARAGIIITSVAGLAAACGLARLGLRLTGDKRTALLVVALWAVAPGAMVLSMLYSEALLCALAAWALVALVERRWLTAGALALVSGTVHSNSAAVIAAVEVAGLIAVIQSARARQPLSALVRPAAAMALAPLGLIAFWAFVAVRLGRLDGLFQQQEVIGTYFDWGAGTLRAVKSAFVDTPSPYVIVAVLAILAGAALVAWSLSERIPAYLHVYTLVIAALTFLVSANFLASKPRLLLPAFLIALPLARLLAPARTYVLIPLITILAVGSAWFTLFFATVAQPP